jgi:hypothetical protein
VQLLSSAARNGEDVVNAAVHRLRAATTSEQERARIMAEARANVANKQNPTAAVASHRMIDPVQAWKRDGEARLARERAAKRERVADRMVKVEELQKKRELQSANEGGWDAWLRAHLDNERAFWRGVIGEVIAEERRRVESELETKVRGWKLRSANCAL